MEPRAAPARRIPLVAENARERVARAKRRRRGPRRSKGTVTRPHEQSITTQFAKRLLPQGRGPGGVLGRVAGCWTPSEFMRLRPLGRSERCAFGIAVEGCRTGPDAARASLLLTLLAVVHSARRAQQGAGNLMGAATCRTEMQCFPGGRCIPGFLLYS
eukprot:tig00021435_g21412.t1